MAIDPQQLAMMQQQQQMAPQQPPQLTNEQLLQATMQLFMSTISEDLNTDVKVSALKTLADTLNILGTDPQQAMQLEMAKAQMDMQLKREAHQLEMMAKQEQAALDIRLKQQQGQADLQLKQETAQFDLAAKAQGLKHKENEHLQKMSAQSEMAKAKAQQANKPKAE